MPIIYYEFDWRVSNRYLLISPKTEKYKSPTRHKGDIMSDTKKTWFTKTVAREALTAKTAELFEAGEITQEVKTTLDGLFAGKVVATNTIVRDDEGVAVLKRCSYFGIYLPVSEFGTVGKDEQGNSKLAYQSKLGAAAARHSKTELENALKEADVQLEETEDIKAWKEAKAEAVAQSEIKAEYDGDAENYATYEDALESIA